MKDKQKNKTAKQAVTTHLADIEVILDWIGMELESHEQTAIDEPNNWGIPNELAHVKRNLKETLAFLSGNEVSEIDKSLEELRM